MSCSVFPSGSAKLATQPPQSSCSGARLKTTPASTSRGVNRSDVVDLQVDHDAQRIAGAAVNAVVDADAEPHAVPVEVDEVARARIAA